MSAPARHLSRLLHTKCPKLQGNQAYSTTFTPDVIADDTCRRRDLQAHSVGGSFVAACIHDIAAAQTSESMAQPPTLQELHSRYEDDDAAVSSDAGAQPDQAAVASDVTAAAPHVDDAAVLEDESDSEDDRVINALDYIELHDGEACFRRRFVRISGGLAAASVRSCSSVSSCPGRPTVPSLSFRIPCHILQLQQRLRVVVLYRAQMTGMVVWRRSAPWGPAGAGPTASSDSGSEPCSRPATACRSVEGAAAFVARMKCSVHAHCGAAAGSRRGGHKQSWAHSQALTAMTSRCAMHVFPARF